MFSLAAILCMGYSLAGGQEEMSPSEDIVTKQVDAFYYCCIIHHGPVHSLYRGLRRAIQLMEDQTIGPTGAAMAVFSKFPQPGEEENLEWEVGFPVSPTIIIEAPLFLKEWTRTQVVEAYHTGPLIRLNETYERVKGWMDVKGLIQDGPFMIMFSDDLDLNDPQDLQVRIWIPYKEKETTAPAR